MRTLSAFLALAIALPAGAQMSAPVAAPRTPATSAVSAAHDLWKTTSGWVLEAAEQVPEARYGFKPSPDVRSFGEVILHVASAHQDLCGVVLGEKEKDLGKPTAKADVVAALRSSIQYCERAYAISDADAMRPEMVFDQPRSALYALMLNASHDSEHYGNIVTYMRILGMVPPSSQPKK